MRGGLVQRQFDARRIQSQGETELLFESDDSVGNQEEIPNDDDDVRGVAVGGRGW
ncbi:D4, zinc and double PHD fingers, family 3 [Isosphaera pallida ATCC 43644]|jgi:hypothetical protein|uniref:D4, zinc and double PHD fingers, family 3 n=1 Tax=Isosphaera pallida (strain ATCC 43644 / DSM 9630 / IS1B) TaxID=575540 RepID=E8QZ87_ISOPI|nr:D4, zinc and double PHD fingers, family 3 [Isosphaera pallida ATCC 43644]